MNLDLNRLRRFAPLVAMLITIGLGWMLFVRPVSADRSRTARGVEDLRQREMAVRLSLSDPSPRVVTDDPAAAFERQVASGDASPALLEQLARLASTNHVRNLLIETVEGTASTAGGATPVASRSDPRFALFDVPVSYVPIRMAFDTEYASLGRFLWAFRDLPTTVEMRTLTVGVPRLETQSGARPAPDGALRVSLTLYAYSRPIAMVLASNTVVAR
ncbi:MAG TPA: hypothetical protein VI485_01350 [Vicinamibacterales bacterium]|nr:hypothetical protein [Vicinamibacterales bacterium]